MHYEIYTAADGIRWRLKAENGKIIAESAQPYKQMAACNADIWLAQGSFNAPIVRLRKERDAPLDASVGDSSLSASPVEAHDNAKA
jgi:uncharacterized protein YegP (UPF0339 family)